MQACVATPEDLCKAWPWEFGALRTSTYHDCPSWILGWFVAPWKDVPPKLLMPRDRWSRSVREWDTLLAANTKAESNTTRPVWSPCQANPPPGVCPKWGHRKYKRIELQIPGQNSNDNGWEMSKGDCQAQLGTHIHQCVSYKVLRKLIDKSLKQKRIQNGSRFEMVL